MSQIPEPAVVRVRVRCDRAAVCKVPRCGHRHAHYPKAGTPASGSPVGRCNQYPFTCPKTKHVIQCVDFVIPKLDALNVSTGKLVDSNIVHGKHVVRLSVLALRKALCPDCKKTSPSWVTGGDRQLPFFEYRPDKQYDLFYCGCRGWN